MPLVSIIIPVYNTEAFLERCLLSIIGQSFTDFEAICIDDCSSDSSARIVKDFAKKDPRINLILHKQNLGPGGARNTGIKAATSNYLAFVDSDDYVDNNMLRDVYAATKGETFDVVNFGYRSLDAAGNLIKRTSPKNREITDAKSFKGRLLVTEPHLWNKLMRKSLFTDFDIWFPLKNRWDDMATVTRVLIKANSFSMIDNIVYSYVDRPGSIVNTVTDQHMLDFFRALDIIKEFLLVEGIYEQEKADLDYLCTVVFGWYADRLRKSKSISPKLAEDSIRFCALLAGSYISADDDLRKNSPDENIMTISRFVRPKQSLLVAKANDHQNHRGFSNALMLLKRRFKR